ncbi:hypothetical protein KEJ21_05315 [Candidatus Bathyarchaeota archaeon]|nr:hypothetical protein [Candidatus Bathyarchaeota archaeon]MBS7631319.1 hypothetical protein [Candidatus Bathyarchaeota archaeon]
MDYILGSLTRGIGNVEQAMFKLVILCLNIFNLDSRLGMLKGNSVLS